MSRRGPSPLEWREIRGVSAVAVGQLGEMLAGKPRAHAAGLLTLVYAAAGARAAVAGVGDMVWELRFLADSLESGALGGALRGEPPPAVGSAEYEAAIRDLVARRLAR